MFLKSPLAFGIIWGYPDDLRLRTGAIDNNCVFVWWIRLFYLYLYKQKSKSYDERNCDIDSGYLGA